MFGFHIILLLLTFVVKNSATIQLTPKSEKMHTKSIICNRPEKYLPKYIYYNNNIRRLNIGLFDKYAMIYVFWKNSSCFCIISSLPWLKIPFLQPRYLVVQTENTNKSSIVCNRPKSSFDNPYIGNKFLFLSKKHAFSPLCLFRFKSRQTM